MKIVLKVIVIGLLMIIASLFFIVVSEVAYLIVLGIGAALIFISTGYIVFTTNKEDDLE